MAVFSRLAPLRGRVDGAGHQHSWTPKAFRADLSAQLTAFVATVGDTVNFEECTAKLRAQSVTCRIEVIDRIAPMSAAFQAMLDRCATEYYVQVDEDMLLFPGAIAILFDAIRRAPPEVAIVCAPLWDVDTERSIYGVKVYRHAIVARYPYASSFSCEMEQVHRFEADGYRLHCLPLVEQGGQALGEHGKRYTPRTAFLRWKRVVQKQRRYGWMGWIEPYHQRHLERWRSTGDPVHLAAVLGMVAGLVGDLPPDVEADFRVADADWERICQRYFPKPSAP